MRERQVNRNTVVLMAMLFSMVLFFVPAFGKAPSAKNLLIDMENLDVGYLKARYTGECEKAAIAFTKESGRGIAMELTDEWLNYTFTLGSGTYKIWLYEFDEGGKKTIRYKTKVSVELENEYDMFRYSNCYVDAENTTVQAVAKVIKENSESDTERILKVEKFVSDWLIYDEIKKNEIVENNKQIYLVDMDQLFQSGKGVCYDYAVMATALIRAQDIPARMMFGFTGNVEYHAWVEAFLEDSEEWIRIDPTYAEGLEDPREYIADDTNYVAVRYY